MSSGLHRLPTSSRSFPRKRGSRGRELGLFPSPLRGGVRGGGRRCDAMNLLKHPVSVGAGILSVACEILRPAAPASFGDRGLRSRAICTTPTPSPSPQGGGERAEFAAALAN